MATLFAIMFLKFPADFSTNFATPALPELLDLLERLELLGFWPREAAGMCDDVDWADDDFVPPEEPIGNNVIHQQSGKVHQQRFY